MNFYIFLLNFCIYSYFVPSILSSNFLNLTEINLPRSHLQYYFHKFPELAKDCLENKSCPYHEAAESIKCWGYEEGCEKNNVYSRPHCPGDHRGWVKTKEAQEDTFYTQADFGYVKEQIDELMIMCEPLFIDDSSLECSKYLRFCRGRNLMLNFTGLASRGDNLRYKMDILGPGQIGGYCRLHKERLQMESDHQSPLQSWAPEMQHFESIHQRPVRDNLCDVVIEKPAYIMKIDATINMYHHFCDFFNLYASLHVNFSHPLGFSKDNQIIVWETYSYDSAFKDTFKVFTDNPILDLKAFRGDVVCFKNVVFPLLPRMIFGLFYNTPIIYGCEQSGLFHAFSTHVLNGLGIETHKRNDKKLRIKLLSRETKYRKILNEEQLLSALNETEDYDVERIVYNKQIPFVKQLEITTNTDIFLGIHGAGLTHLLFLPDWAAIFELYNCEDSGCYHDLARLRGVKYITWEDKEKLFQEDQGHHPEGGAHPKFTNFAFNVNEVLRLVKIAADHVKNHKAYKEFIGETEEARDEL